MFDSGIFMLAAAWLNALTAESFNAFSIPERTAPSVIEKFQKENKTFPLGTRIAEIKTKSQSETCGRTRIFRLQKI